MKKFEVGDRVVRIGVDNKTVPVGSIGIVRHIDSYDWCKVDWLHKPWPDGEFEEGGNSPGYLELIARGEQKMAFNVGDRVRRTAHLIAEAPYNFRAGMLGLVVPIRLPSSKISVRWDNLPGTTSYGANEFEKLELVHRAGEEKMATIPNVEITFSMTKPTMQKVVGDLSGQYPSRKIVQVDEHGRTISSCDEHEKEISKLKADLKNAASWDNARAVQLGKLETELGYKRAALADAESRIGQLTMEVDRLKRKQR